MEAKKSFDYIETGIDWKNKRMKSEETGIDGESQNMNYVGNVRQLESLVESGGDRKGSGKRHFRKKIREEKIEDIIIDGDEDRKSPRFGRSPNRQVKRTNKKSGHNLNKNSISMRKSPRVSKNSSRQGSPSLSTGMSKKKNHRFASPSLPSQDVLISRDAPNFKKSNLKKANSKTEKSNREVTFGDKPVSKVMSSNEMLKDIERLKKKKHLTIDQKRLLAIYEQMK